MLIQHPQKDDVYVLAILKKMEYTRYLLCCLVLCLSSVPGGLLEEEDNLKGPGTLPAPSGVVTTLLSLKNMLIFVSHCMVCVLVSQAQTMNSSNIRLAKSSTYHTAFLHSG